MEALEKKHIDEYIQKAAEAIYPIEISRIKCGDEEDWREIDINKVKRDAFIKGFWAGFNFKLFYTPTFSHS